MENPTEVAAQLQEQAKEQLSTLQSARSEEEYISSLLQHNDIKTPSLLIDRPGRESYLTPHLAP